MARYTFRGEDGVETDLLSPPESANFTTSRLLMLARANNSENLTRLFKKLQPYMSNRAMDDTPLIGLLVAYVILILTGASGNGLVCVAVARKPQMRTARNIFIINLAISDLILCLFTMPFSLVEILMKFWPLGVVTCKLVAGLQGTSIFVSTISITAIALDRYKVIVYPTQESCRPLRAFFTLSCIWLIAFLLSTPLFLFRSVDHIYVGFTWLESVDYCIESWPVTHGRGFYSLFSMLFQYLLPICIVSIAYARICRKLKCRMEAKGTKLQEKQERDKRRMKKTNILLISIALIFGLSWLPLNILNLVADFCYPFNDDATFRIVFACCHMAGMSSACSNPLLYGWLNENFRKEFKDIFSSCCNKSAGGKNGGNEGTESFVLGTKNQAHAAIAQQVQVETALDGTALEAAASPDDPTVAPPVSTTPATCTDISPNATVTVITSVPSDIDTAYPTASVVDLAAASPTPTIAVTPTPDVSADIHAVNTADANTVNATSSVPEIDAAAFTIAVISNVPTSMAAVSTPTSVDIAATPTSVGPTTISPTLQNFPLASISNYSSTIDANHSVVVTLPATAAIVKVV